MKMLHGLYAYFTSSIVLAGAHTEDCKCTPNSSCWPSDAEWSALNVTLAGNLIRGVPPGSVCYPSEANYNEDQCAIARAQWTNSTWQAQDPIGIDYPVEVNNSCNPIYPNGTSVTGDVNAGKKGCTMGSYAVYAVKATTAEHVSTALDWAGKKNVRVVVKSTGHSILGRSTGYGSLSIWTHHMRGIQYIPSFKPTSCPINGTLQAARVAAGHTGAEVLEELAKYNAIIVTGANPDVGIVGWLTGGGHGLLSRTYGMGADNLLEATIVTPDGKVLLANPCQNSDIFFAIRGGGGGTFGVVLEVVVKAFPSPKTTMHFFTMGTTSPNVSTEFWDFMGDLYTDMPRLKEGGMQGYHYIFGPPTYTGLGTGWIFFLYDKPNGTVEALMAPIEKRLKRHADLFAYTSNTTESDSYWPLYRAAVQNEDVSPGGAAIGSRLLTPESLKDAKVSAKLFAQIGPSSSLGSKNAPFSNPTIISHVIAHPEEPSYYPQVISMNPGWRDALTHFLVTESWPDGISQSLINTAYSDMTRNKIEPLRKLSPHTGAYFNEADKYEPEWKTAFWGENYDRLRRIKEKYDPNNILWCRRCVGSDALVERSDGALCKASYAAYREHIRREADGQKEGWGADFPDGAGRESGWNKKREKDGNPWHGKRHFDRKGDMRRM